jgi:hypothetical protein
LSKIIRTFNPNTIIKYELFEASYVKLKVFDLIGKEIATLVESSQAPGSYSVEFDASRYANLTSGIYFIRNTNIYRSKENDIDKVINPA